MRLINRRDAETQRGLKVRHKASLRFLCVSASWFFLLPLLVVTSCSVPNLEPAECTESRDTVKQFYSWYLGNNAEQRAKSPEMFSKYVADSQLTPADAETDPFVLTNDFPKAFRVGECTVVEPAKRTRFEVLLFWKDDARTEQSTIKVETEKIDNKWIIRSVTN